MPSTVTTTPAGRSKTRAEAHSSETWIAQFCSHPPAPPIPVDAVEAAVVLLFEAWPPPPAMKLLEDAAGAAVLAGTDRVDDAAREEQEDGGAESHFGSGARQR